jgi:Mg-chelatase subunit ChlD
MNLGDFGVALSEPRALALLVLLAAIVLIDRTGLRARTAARRAVQLIVRLLLLLILVLAIAQPVFWTGSDLLSTVFLLDRSASVSPAQQQQAVSWVESAIATKRPTDRVAAISFAGDAAVEQPLSDTPGAIAPNAQLDTSHTDLAGALRLAQGVLPLGGARRIVLLTDGDENQGSALSQTAALRAAGIPVDVVPLNGSAGPEVALHNLSLPPAIHKGESFTINVVIDSTTETSAQLRLLVDGKLDQTQSLQLHVGENSLVYGHDALSPGEHTFQAIVESPNDTLPENNVGYATLQVAGPPRVLLVEGDPGNAKALAAALQADGLTVDVEAPSILGDVVGLRQYDAVGLLNVPATRIGADSLIALRSYVQDFGGGLVAIGGDRSYAAGDYRNTPLEDVLPVTMNVRGRATHANVTLLLVIDVSGSMAEGPEGATKIELAREAATGAVAQLGDQDQVGILAFDDKNHWIYPTNFLTDRATVNNDIAELEPGGGTEIYPALQEAYGDIIQRPGKVKHILLMTDGLAPNGDYEGLTAQMRAKGVTLSTIAIGTDADPNLLQNLADWGRGRFYDATNPLDVPRFVIQETTEVARAAITEETFTPAAQDQSPILDGIGNLPPIYGYVATTPKSSAVVGLVSPEGDPVLAQWQFGLGRAVAFTSDAGARWSAAWTSWADYARFWGQVFRWTVPTPQGQTLQVQSTVENGVAHVVVDAIGADGRFVDGATTAATVVSPRQTVSAAPAGASASSPTPTAPEIISLPQVAPGRYAVDVPATQPGSYLVQVSQTLPGQTAPAAQTAGFVVPYSPEFAGLPPDVGLLREIAQQTGGVVATAPADSFAHNLRLADEERPIWPWLIEALVPLFLLDVAIRRLRFSGKEVSLLLGRLRERWLGQTGPAARLANRLMAARQPSLATDAAPRPLRRPAIAAVRPPPPPPVRRPLPGPPPPAAAAGPAGSRLLTAKRRAAPAGRAGPRG